MAKLTEYKVVKRELPIGSSKNVLGIFEINAPFRNLGGLGQLIPFKDSKRAQKQKKMLINKFSKGQTKIVSSVERRKTSNFSVSFLSHNNRNLKVIAEHPNSNFCGIEGLLEHKTAEKGYDRECESRIDIKTLPHDQINDYSDEVFNPTVVKKNMQTISTQLAGMKLSSV